MSSFTDLLAFEGFVMRLSVPGVFCAAGVCMQAWVMRPGAVRLLGMAAVTVLVGLLSACSSAPKSGVGAVKVPPKIRYILKATELVDKKWHFYLEQRKNDAAFGGVEVAYWLDKKGQVAKMAEVGANGASPDLVRLTKDAIRDAEIPRMTADVISGLEAKDGGYLRLIYKAYIPPTKKGGMGTALDAKLTPEERAAREARVRWNKEHLSFGQHAPGENPLELKETPTRRYGKLVTGRVERQWKIYLMQSKVPAAGDLDVVFYVNSKGKVESPKATIQKGCAPGLTELTLRAIRDAEIPPMPAEVRSALPAKSRGLLNCLFHVSVH